VISKNAWKVTDFILSMKRSSKHCKGKNETVFAYDHTGYLKWECDCGHISDWEKITSENM